MLNYCDIIQLITNGYLPQFLRKVASEQVSRAHFITIYGVCPNRLTCPQVQRWAFSLPDLVILVVRETPAFYNIRSYIGWRSHRWLGFSVKSRMNTSLATRTDEDQSNNMPRKSTTHALICISSCKNDLN